MLHGREELQKPEGRQAGREGGETESTGGKVGGGVGVCYGRVQVVVGIVWGWWGRLGAACPAGLQRNGAEVSGMNECRNGMQCGDLVGEGGGGR